MMPNYPKTRGGRERKGEQGKGGGGGVSFNGNEDYRGPEPPSFWSDGRNLLMQGDLRLFVAVLVAVQRNATTYHQPPLSAVISLYHE